MFHQQRTKYSIFYCLKFEFGFLLNPAEKFEFNIYNFRYTCQHGFFSLFLTHIETPKFWQRRKFFWLIYTNNTAIKDKKKYKHFEGHIGDGLKKTKKCQF